MDIEALRRRLGEYFIEEGASESTLSELEQLLGVSLPDSFRSVSLFFDGGVLGGVELYRVRTDANEVNVYSETVRLRRAIGLPEKFIVLGEPPAALLVLDCSDGTVVYCDATDAELLGSDIGLWDPDTWGSYQYFIENLAILEDEERAEGFFGR